MLENNANIIDRQLQRINNDFKRPHVSWVIHTNDQYTVVYAEHGSLCPTIFKHVTG